MKAEDKGGHYSTQNARYDHQSLNHFVSVNGNHSGLAISNRDCLFMKLGNSTTTFLDQNSAQINVLVGGQIDKEFRLGIVNQDGDSLFVQHFSILPQNQAMDNVQAMKFSMEHQNPCVVNLVKGGGIFQDK